MRIISETRIKAFWRSRRSGALAAERAFSAWIKAARAARWKDFGALKQTFGSADVVGDCVVFDVGNNRYRLIGRVRYGPGIVYVLAVMDHREYDRGHWAQDCGCHEPSPRRRSKKGGMKDGGEGSEPDEAGHLSRAGRRVPPGAHQG